MTATGPAVTAFLVGPLFRRLAVLMQFPASLDWVQSLAHRGPPILRQPLIECAPAVRQPLPSLSLSASNLRGRHPVWMKTHVRLLTVSSLAGLLGV
jgi:hypothetical protein